MTIAGAKITLPLTVAFFDVDVRRPIYHSAPYSTSRSVEGVWTRTTLCGLVVFRQLDHGDEREHRAVEIPARHARRFGRPCLRCWPELLTGQLELTEAPL